MHEIEIESLAFGGEAVGHLDGKVVFVAFAAPGDLVRLRILHETASYFRGELLDVLRPGPGRRQSPCPYFGRCGGCQWQHLGYQHQVQHKERVWRAALGELARADFTFQGAPRELGYRRRVRMHWQHGAAGLQLGYQRWRSHELLDVTHCPLLEEPLQRGIDACRRALSGCAGGAGTVAALLGADSEVQISLRIERGDAGWVRGLARRGVGGPVVGGVVQLGRTPAASFGAPSIALPDALEGAPPLQGTAAVFVQASAEGEQALRNQVRKWSVAQGARVLELHAGIGTFTCALARDARQVVAVELAGEAANLLRDNCARLPVTVREGDAAAVARKLAATGERFDVAVMDPPRQGCLGLAEVIARLDVQRFIYVSCDPMTMVRDLRQALAQGFRLSDVVGFDLMPQSYHVESVALLER